MSDQTILTIGQEVRIGGERVKIVDLTIYIRRPFRDSDIFCTFERSDGSRFRDVYYHIELLENDQVPIWCEE
jgi:hypothetical protein